MRRSEAIFRVSAQIFTIKDRTVVCSQMFEASVSNVVQMQTEIARAVCERMSLLREIPRCATVSPKRLAAGSATP